MSKQTNLKLITTEDGSHSIYRKDLNETYHSTRGAVGESQYVFIEKGLSDFLNENPESKAIRILEVGMGTGLNVWLSMVWSKKKSFFVDYISLEPYPIAVELAQELNYSDNDKLFMSIHEVDWGKGIFLSEQFNFKKEKCTLEDYSDETRYDVIFFDAFAPSRQPDVWQLSNLEKCYQLLNPGGWMVTYCASGQFKRDLNTAGFSVEVLPGAMGKKEMVRARKIVN